MIMYVEMDDERYPKGMIVILEQQSTPVKDDKMRVVVDAKNQLKVDYGLPVFVCFLMSVDPESSIREYFESPTELFKPFYIHFPWGEIEKRLNNLSFKLENNLKLNDVKLPRLVEAVDF